MAGWIRGWEGRDESWRQILGWEQLNGQVSFEGREGSNARLDGCL